MMESPPTADVLRETLGATPTTYSFDMGQTREVRAEMMAMVPAAAQKAMLAVLTEHVLSLEDCDLRQSSPLYYMATEDESIEDGEEEARQHSPDWRLDVYRGPAGTLYDFNGWPGDNESGAGLFAPRGEGALRAVFANGDQCLTAMASEHREVVEEFERERTARREGACPSCGAAGGPACGCKW